MTKYQLSAIDWSTVRLLHGEHLSYETRYHEELTRWSLGVTGRWGVLKMPEGSLVVTPSSKDFEVRLAQLRALTPDGFWIEVQDMLVFQDLNTQYTGLEIPIYLCIEANKRSLPLAASQTRALAEVNALQMNYFLATHRPAHALDALQIARLTKKGSEFRLDESYIPPCVCLNSHPTLITAVQRIADVAQKAVELIRLEYACKDFKISHVLAAAIAQPLSELEIVIDWSQSPFTYLERAGRSLRQLHLLIQPLMKLNLSPWNDAENALREAWESLARVGTPNASSLPLHQLLEGVENALNKLIPLLKQLREPPPEYRSREPEVRVEGHRVVTPVDLPLPNQSSRSELKGLRETD